MSRIISPGNLYSKISEFLFLFNHMYEFLHFYLFIYFLEFYMLALLCENKDIVYVAESSFWVDFD
jgi:hypothetical protein